MNWCRELWKRLRNWEKWWVIVWMITVVVLLLIRVLQDGSP